MKKFIALIAWCICITMQAQTFKDAVGYGLFLDNYCKVNKAGDVLWNHDGGEEQWQLHQNGILVMLNTETGTLSHYYSLSGDGKTLFLYSDAAKRKLTNSIRIFKAEKSWENFQGKRITVANIFTLDTNDIGRLFKVILAIN